MTNYKDTTRAHGTRGRTARIPLAVNTYLPPTDGQSDLSAEEIKLYQTIVGSINYLAQKTRPDIAQAAGHFGKFLHNPSRIHLERLTQFLEYLASTLDTGLVYTSGQENSIKVWSDANFANDKDRHSTMAHIIVIAGNIISWLSKRIRNICLSTEETELTSASEATRELKRVKSLATELKLIKDSDEVILFIDNEPAVKAINNPGYYGRLKHLDISQKYVMEASKEGLLKVQWCSGSDMLADPLTKPVAAPAIEAFRRVVMKST